MTIFETQQCPNAELAIYGEELQLELSLLIICFFLFLFFLSHSVDSEHDSKCIHGFFPPSFSFGISSEHLMAIRWIMRLEKNVYSWWSHGKTMFLLSPYLNFYIKLYRLCLSWIQSIPMLPIISHWNAIQCLVVTCVSRKNHFWLYHNQIRTFQWLLNFIYIDIITREINLWLYYVGAMGVSVRRIDFHSILSTSQIKFIIGNRKIKQLNRKHACFDSRASFFFIHSLRSFFLVSSNFEHGIESRW